MKKLLVLAYEYCPIENANTRIIRHTCELLAERFVAGAETEAREIFADMLNRGL